MRVLMSHTARHKVSFSGDVQDFEEVEMFSRKGCFAATWLDLHATFSLISNVFLNFLLHC